MCQQCLLRQIQSRPVFHAHSACHPPSHPSCTPRQAPSPAVVAHPKLSLANTDPLRRSLPELAAGDAGLREQLRASLAAEAGSGCSGGSGARPHGAASAIQTAQGQPARYADLLGLQEEETQQNMASPVLPSRHGSRCATPAAAGQAAQECLPAERADSLARRSLMGGPGYSAVSSAAAQQQRPQYVHPQQSLQHAARQQQPSSAGAGHAKASHVSLTQLLAMPSSVATAAAVASGRPALRPKQAGQAATGMRRNNSGAKRGREAMGASRRPSGKPCSVARPAWRCMC